MLDDLSHASGELIIRKCAKHGNIRVYKLWHMEGTHHVFIGVKIDTGLSADTGIHLRKKCGRDLYKIHTAKVSRCDESAEITGNASAQCDEKVLSVIVV